MVTGDNKTTATAIARECNIIPEDLYDASHTTGTEVIMEGPEFYERLGGLICKNPNCMKEPS